MPSFFIKQGEGILTIWIGQNDQQRGPYSEAEVRQWLAEGKFTADVLAWREGMAEWAPVHTLFPDVVNKVPPPSVPPFSATSANSNAFAASVAQNFAAQHDHSYGTTHADREDLPAPPSMHWGVLLLLSIVTLGLFSLVWSLVQANWVRKVDGQSKAMLLLWIAIGCFAVGEPIYFAGILNGAAGGGMLGMGGLLVFTYWVLLLVACFSMANSIRRVAADYNLPMDIGGVTLFFFKTLYLQGQIHWLARWKATGRTSPVAPKGVFYLLWFGSIFVVAILAAISIPAYQSYLVRAQVAEAVVLSSSAKTAVAAYYSSNGKVPLDNAAVGLADSGSISGKYVSSVDVSNGKITVAFETAAANLAIRDRVLVLTPGLRGETLVWSCGDSTLPSQDLPLSCRN
jgi:hypothetical protein